MSRSPLLALVAALTVGTVAGAAELTRSPYIQDVRTNSAVVAFQLDAACREAVVRYGAQGGPLEGSAPSTSTGREHGVTLSGLAPATSYSYQVEACGVTSQPRTFVSASGPETRRVHFAAMGDFGVDSKDQRAVSEAMRAARPELWLALGDNAYEDGTVAEFQSRFFAPMAPLLAEVPAYLIMGNHDYLTDQGQPQIDLFHLPSNNPRKTERYYSFNWGPVHFVALDSQCHSGWTTTPECVPSEQVAWLEQDLAANTQPWTVVFMHHPPYSSGEHGGNPRVHDLLPIFERHGVDMVLGGHDHEYERTKPMKAGQVVAPGEGVPYWVVGTGGVRLKPFAQSMPSTTAYRNNTDFGFLDVVVDGGTLTANFRNVEGKAVDTFTVTKSVPEPELPAPTLSLEAGSAAGNPPHATTLTATTNLPDAQVTWTLGDGSTQQGATISHTWSAPGTYEVTATAVGQDGRSATATLTITVAEGATPPPPPPPPAAEDGGDQTGTPQAPGASGEEPSSPEGSTGCNATPAALLLPLGLAALLPAVRRHRRRRETRD